MGAIVGGNCGPLSGALVRWQIKQWMLLFWRSSALGLITRCTTTPGALFIDAACALKCTVTAVGGIVLSHSKKLQRQTEKSDFSPWTSAGIHPQFGGVEVLFFSVYQVNQTFILELTIVFLSNTILLKSKTCCPIFNKNQAFDLC